MFEVVGWTIVIAFIATTIIALLGIMGVVALPANIRNKLFTVLILEIVASGFFLFRQGLSPEQEYFRQAQALMEKAQQAKEANDVEKADQLLGQILKLSVKDVPFEIRQVFRTRGDLAYDKQIWDQAVNSYRIFYEIQPDNLKALVRYGRALRAVKRYEEAAKVYERARQLSPNNYGVLNGLQNNARRMGGFLQEAERTDAAEEWFEKARVYITAMLKISPNQKVHEKRYLNTILARARLNWQWERYPQAVALYRDIIREFPKFAQGQEDLAAILIEYADHGGGPEVLGEAKRIYARLYKTTPDGSSRVYIGSGYAEAVGLDPNATVAELKEAKTATLLSLGLLEGKNEDPFPFYATSIVLHRLNERDLAIKYLKDAIRHEKQRANNPYTFDYKRLFKYEQLLQRWADMAK